MASSSSSDSDDDAPSTSLTINSSYAKSYEERKRREEALRYVSSSDDDDESDASEDDEEAAELTPAVKDRVMETIKMIREKDPRIYDEGFRPFEGTEVSAEAISQPTTKEKKTKPVTYKDMVRQNVLKRVANGDDDAFSESSEEEPQLTYGEANAESKRALQAALSKHEGSSDASSEASSDDFLVPKAKTKPRLDANTATGSNRVPVESQPLKSSDEAFLWKYIQDNAWRMDGQEGFKPPVFKDEGDDELEKDEEEIERADAFEAKYNFRFEEPGSSKIVTHSREVEGSLRRKEDSRKQKRERKKEKEAEEERARQEELKRLKNMRKKIIEEELGKAFAAGGVKKGTSSTISADVLDEDFDPATWDAKMAQIYGDDYYDEEDEEFDGVENSEDEAEVVRKLVGEMSEEEEEEEEDQQQEEELEEPTEKETQLKQVAATVKAQVDRRMSELTASKPELSKKAKEKPVFKFRYRRVQPNDYGLTTDEILAADDKLLNQYVSIKRIVPYSEAEYHANAKARRKFREELEKRHLLANPKMVKKQGKEERLGKLMRMERARGRAVASESASSATAPPAKKVKGVSSARAASYE